ncbi:hypothetical protein QFC22_000711 [Naganishia vaughanmartiniae]|uniref:Uncharacterized protein n=1 Tax=Naganishia vaughanmartiniae TaxID=1424756 RepID=A0ACC2XJX8_9TREE|nr:hypothetical protein QFC22_000711 [Naganishia vaughanmartiniae]
MAIPEVQLVPGTPERLHDLPTPPRRRISDDNLQMLGAPLSAIGESSSHSYLPKRSLSPTPAMTADTTTESDGSDLVPRTTSRSGGTVNRSDSSMREEVLVEEASLSGSAIRGTLRKTSRPEGLPGDGVVSRKSSRDWNGTDDQDEAASHDDEARYPRHTQHDRRIHSRTGRESGSESAGREDIRPSNSTTATNTTSSHDERETLAQGMSSLLLTLKPRKSSRSVRQGSEEPQHESFETDGERAIPRDEQHSSRRREGNGSHGTSEQKPSTRSSSSRRVRDRKPPPINGSPEFKHFVLPHARVSRAPTSGMYISQYPYQGHPPPKALRAHTGTLVGNCVYFIGGCDKYGCWPGVAVFNTETHMWRTLKTGGETALPPLRAHTTTLVGKILYVFGGGDGPTYSNDVYAFDTFTHTWSKPRIATPPSERPLPRRAHTAVHYTHHLLIFGGGNGQAALNDVWVCDVRNPAELRWEEWRATGDLPVCKGYHTANLVGEKMVVYGGSDGVHSFANVHVLDILNHFMALRQQEEDIVSLPTANLIPAHVDGGSVADSAV